MTRRSALRRLPAILATGALLATGATVATTKPGTADTLDLPGFAPQLVRVHTVGARQRDTLTALGFDIGDGPGAGYTDVVLTSAADAVRLRVTGFTWTVRVKDLAAQQARNNLLDARYAARVKRSALPSGRTSYRTLEDYNTEMAAMAKQHSALVKKITLPRPSLDGRTIYGVEIGAGVRRPNHGQPTFFIMGAHHAREWPSAENTMEFAVDLVKNFGSDKQITRLLKRARVLVVPVVNADGFDLSRTSGDVLDLNFLNAYDPTGLVSIAASLQAYKRKNCRVVDGVDTPDGTCAATLADPAGFGTGVDLNRNYGGLWGGPGAAAQAPTDGNFGPLDPTYRGAAPFSEPETENIRDLIGERQVTMLITNHTYGDLILRPNGVNPQTTGSDGQPVGDSPDEKAMKELGAAMAAQNGYANQHGWELYDTTGTTEDWSYNTTGGFGYTFEMGATEFHPPFSDVVDMYEGSGQYAGKGNRGAFLIALQHAVDTRYSGVLKGSATPGAVLTLSKTFRTPTWDSSIPDALSSSMTVPASGSFRWIVNPSTRPIVLTSNPKAREVYTLTCSVKGKVRSTSKVYIARGQVKTLGLGRC